MDEADNDPHRRRVLKMTGGAVAGAALSQGRAQAAPPSDIVGMSAVALAAAIHARKVSCVEVIGAYLDHIERVNPAVNAIVSLQDRDGLIKQAADRDAQLARKETVGPLHGFPMAPKDLQSVKGLPYTQGSPI